ncbi:MAG TPA: GNAT family N-acetyltransferase [Acidimicrobiales bacterium]|nr:GNAT family N-acetyltransferase [Acidimicrobiales bacterium]
MRVARFAELTPDVLYRILKLRSDVFVVEQECAYADLDGRDMEPDALHLWTEADGAVVAYLRVISGPPAGARRIGRVVTAPGSRGEGLARDLMHKALAETMGSVVLDAQSHLVEWYQQLGFRVAGTEFVEDGIPHVPMRLER